MESPWTARLMGTRLSSSSSSTRGLKRFDNCVTWADGHLPVGRLSCKGRDLAIRRPRRQGHGEVTCLKCYIGASLLVDIVYACVCLKAHHHCEKQYCNSFCAARVRLVQSRTTYTRPLVLTSGFAQVFVEPPEHTGKSYAATIRNDGIEVDDFTAFGEKKRIAV